MAKTETEPKTLKFRALTTVILEGPDGGTMRLRGDNELGIGRGMVGVLVDRFKYKINPWTYQPELDRKTGEPIKEPLTAEQQFSPRNMVRVPDDTPESSEYISAQLALTMKQHKLGDMPGKRAQA